MMHLKKSKVMLVLTISYLLNEILQPFKTKLHIPFFISDHLSSVSGVAIIACLLPMRIAVFLPIIECFTKAQFGLHKYFDFGDLLAGYLGLAIKYFFIERRTIFNHYEYKILDVNSFNFIKSINKLS